MDLITVIVPVYKVEKYLRRCVDSILAQTYTNLEIILVDDGSPDNCGKICDEYAENDSRIKVIHQKNGGLSAARNAGLDIATGDYIGFVDSDDYIERDMYESLYISATRNDADISSCNFIKVDENGNTVKTEKQPAFLILDNMKALEMLQSDYDLNFVIVCNKLFKSHLFDNIRFPLNRYYEDNYVIHNLLYNCKVFSTTGSTKYFYVQKNGGIMNSLNSSNGFDEIGGFLERYRFFKEKELTNLIPGAQQYFMYSYRRQKAFYTPKSEDEKELMKKYDIIAKRIYAGCKDNMTWKDHLAMNCFPLYKFIARTKNIISHY
ncbi:MAG: glycosyltransferase [Clostridia bacterium]|nr:glycosyltransferase [Clostridia bacterium]